MLTNTTKDSEVQSGIMKTDISDHSVCLDENKFGTIKCLKILHKKRYWNEDSIKYFKSVLKSADLDLTTQISTPDSSYNIFLDKFVKFYKTS